MGLFDKKYCDVCGNKIRLLGNNKLSNGNLCNDCERQLSVWFKDHRTSTVDQIQEQLKDREANKQLVSQFQPSRQFGIDSKFVLVDERMGRFVILRNGEAMDKNPDLLEIAKVSNPRMTIEETTTEIKRKDAEGKSVSFNPRHYSYRYHFNFSFDYDGKWVHHVEFPLSLSSVDGGKDGDRYNGMMNSSFNGNQFANQLLNMVGASLGNNMGMNSSMSGSPITSNRFEERADLPGGYRPNCATNMRATNIRVYQELEALGRELEAYFMNSSMQNAGYGQPGMNGGWNQGYGQQNMNGGWNQNQGYNQPNMNGNWNQNQGYGQPNMNGGWNQNQGYNQPNMNGSWNQNPGYGQQNMNGGWNQNPGYDQPQNMNWNQNQGYGQQPNMNQNYPQDQNFSQQGNAGWEQTGFNGTDAGFAAAGTASGETWTCTCGAVNTGKFCEYCGAPKP